MKTGSRLCPLFAVTLLTSMALLAVSLIIPPSYRQVDYYWHKVAWSEILLLIFWLGIFNSSFSSKRSWYGISPAIAVTSSILVGSSFAFLFVASLYYPKFFPRLYFIIEIFGFILAAVVIFLFSIAADKARNSSEEISQETTNLRDIETMISGTIERLKVDFPDQIKISGMLKILLERIRFSFVINKKNISSGLIASMCEMTRNLCLYISECMDSKDFENAEANISKQVGDIKVVVADMVTRSKSR